MLGFCMLAKLQGTIAELRLVKSIEFLIVQIKMLCCKMCVLLDIDRNAFITKRLMVMGFSRRKFMSYF